ncbi:MAG TPA: geranylgeranylglycerol-phosphate geranylgeranyltransferase [Thermoplasmata archaeon]
MHPALRLVRFGNTLVSFAGVLVGGLVARGAGIDVPLSFVGTVLLAALSSSLVTAGGNVLNDLLDRDSDRLNHPDRPLVTGAISVATARWLSAGLLAASVVAILPIALSALWLPVILAVALGALLSYEFRFKPRGFVGNVLVALLTGLVFLYGGAAANAPLLLVPFAGMAFAATLSRELIKDMEDAGGDVDRRTLPQTRGFPVATALARLSVGGAIALSPIPLLAFVAPGAAAGIIYLALVLAADALFVLSVARLPAELHRGQTISKGAMTVALLAFLSVAFR